MGKFYDTITEAQADLIAQSQLFFVASVAPDLSAGPGGEGAVNVSPKGGVPLHVIDERTVAYLDYPGSGNETGRHAEAGGPVTVMVISMEAEDAGIVRLYGHAHIETVEHSVHADRLVGQLAEHLIKPRQIVVVKVEGTQTSCGYGVPIYSYVGQRPKDARGRKYK